MTDVCVKTINELFAYILKNGGIPIQKPEQMLPDKHLVYKPLDEEWQKSINESKRWATGYTGNNPNNQALQADYRIRDKLLSFGGFEACVEYQDPDAEAILYRGQFWYGDKVDFMKGKPSDCHRNSCELWEINRSNIKIAIVTGYALSYDGMWRQHSWLVRRKPRSVRLIETTEPRIGYFGFVMSDEEAIRFCRDNF